MNELCRGRVLIVDDDPRFPEHLKQTFGQRGFLVQGAEGKGEALRESARRMVREFRPHVTIMDLRLLEGQKPPDLSGISLIDEPDFALTRCVVYSAYLGNDHVLARDLKERPNVDDVVGRQEFSRLVSAVQNSFNKRCACCVLYTVKWPKAWKPESVVEALFGKGSGVPPDVILDVLGRLFPKGARLSLDTLEGAAATTHSVSRGHSVLLRATIPNRVPSVIKLAPSHRVLKEVAAYDQYVDESLGGSYHVEKKAARIFWDVGAIRYKFLGSPGYPVRTLADFYAGADDADSILRPLRHFFEVVWRPHYMETRVKLEESLFDAYDRAFGLRERIAELLEDAGDAAFPGARPELPDPLRWALEHEPDSGTFTAHLAVTHGDLHADNLFVEADHAWAIDFERTGPGPILRDFVELEHDIVTRLLPLGEDDHNEFFQFALALAAPRTPSEPPRLPGPTPPRAEIRKALEVVAGLRKMAQEVALFTDIREYYWGLLLDSLVGSSLAQKDSPQRQRSMLLAAVIAHRLEKNVQWPPDWARRRLQSELRGAATPVRDGEPPPKEYDVFLSYNSKDLEVAERLVWLLREAGVSVWYDREMNPGDKWLKELERHLARSKNCLICYGASGLSDWQELEKEVAFGSHVKWRLHIIPTLLPGCEQADVVSGFTGVYQICDLRGGVDSESEEFRKLLDALRK